jgi:hypothetical protein
MPFTDRALHAVLDLASEVAAIHPVDSSIHEAEAVGRTDNCIASDLENRSVVHADELQIAAEAPPSLSQIVLDCGQHQFHAASLSHLPAASSEKKLEQKIVFI